MKLLLKYFRFLFIFPAVLVVLISSTEIKAESDLFPQYSCIQPNVDFWKKIYSEYPSNQGVLHDKRRLDIIYGVIELKNPDLPGGRKINRNRIKAARKKFRSILSKLMRGETPARPEEQHVADLFGPDAKAGDYRSAIRNIRCQTGQKDRFREGVIRSGAYLEKMKKIFRDSGLPEDLTYLPHVESSFNPRAYSKFGAAGVWQFTRSTGRRYLAIGYTIDERRDPIISSYAAAKLLKANFKKLQNWPMAMTAYNHGISGMLRAKRRKGSYEAIFEGYRSRLFKFASRNFYSEFLAAREIAKHYRLYFGELKLDLPVDTTEVILDGYASLPDIAHHLQLDLADISKLNPALRKPVVRGQKYVPKGYRLQLPADTGQDWISLIAELSPKLFKSFQKRSRIYTVQRGDTAGAIAKIHGVKLRDLIAANNLDSRATIYINQNLRIPLPDDKAIQLAKYANQRKSNSSLAKSASAPPVEGRALDAPTVDLWIAMNSDAKYSQTEETMVAESSAVQADKAKSELRSPMLVAGVKPRPGEEEKPPESFAVKPVESDNRKGAVPVLAGLKPEYVQESEAAELPMAKPMESRPAPVTDVAKPAVSVPISNPQILQADLAIDRVWTQKGKKIGTIKVEVEETLGHYAEWLNLTAWEIRKLNGFSYARMIHIDQQIKIPLHRATREEFEEKRFEYHKELTEDFFANYRVEKVEVYLIKRGDNIWTLSRNEFEVPLWLIRRFNADMDFNALVPSQKLLIPIVTKIT